MRKPFDESVEGINFKTVEWFEDCLLKSLENLGSTGQSRFHPYPLRGHQVIQGFALVRRHVGQRSHLLGQFQDTNVRWRKCHGSPFRSYTERPVGDVHRPRQRASRAAFAKCAPGGPFYTVFRASPSKTAVQGERGRLQDQPKAVEVDNSVFSVIRDDIMSLWSRNQTPEGVGPRCSSPDLAPTDGPVPR